MAQVDLSHPALQAFVRGYRTAQPIADEELERLPLFLRLHNVVQFARITRSLEAGPLAKEPEWMPNLRIHLLGLLAKLRAGFASTPYSNE